MSVIVIPLEFERIQRRTKRAMGWSAIVHVFLIIALAHLLGQQQQAAEEAVEVTWLDPARAKPAPPAPAPAAAAAPAAEPKPAAPKPAAAAAKPAPKKPTPPENRGTVGRARAKEATKELATATASIDGVLAGLDAVLETSTDASATTRRAPRRSAVRGGRAASELGGVGGLPSSTVGGDGSSALGGARIEVGAIGGVEGGSGSAVGGTADGTATGSSGGSSRGDLRSDASLLAVVRKYAPGIRFCYENELKKKPGLGGKLIVAITVAAAGNVTEAVIVQDTLGSAALTSCALAQIQAWRFPAIPQGVVTFRAPFVFTPPKS